MKAIRGYRAEGLAEEWRALGIPAYRARQVLAWVWRRGATSFEEMTDLPVALRDVLRRDYSVLGSRVVSVPRGEDRTLKYLLELADGRCVESVLIPAADGRRTACLSTQVGCPLACGFCASGLAGLERNLSAGEILDQYLAMRRASTAPVTNVVFMGMGEPLLNLPNVLDAIEALTGPPDSGGGVGARRITISTAGVAPGILKLAAYPAQIRLSVSLHAATDDLRSRLMPINRRYPIGELMRALKSYQAQTGRQVTFEYILLSDVNDSPRQAQELAGLVAGLSAKVNLIPANRVPETPYRAPPRGRCDAFAEALRRRGVPVTLRVRKGAGIDAACGQLRLRKMGNRK